jgi:hypothetical protein
MLSVLGLHRVDGRTINECVAIDGINWQGKRKYLEETLRGAALATHMTACR